MKEDEPEGGEFHFVWVCHVAHVVGVRSIVLGKDEAGANFL